MISKIESTPKRGCCVMNINLADFVIELGPVGCREICYTYIVTDYFGLGNIGNIYYPKNGLRYPVLICRQLTIGSDMIHNQIGSETTCIDV